MSYIPMTEYETSSQEVKNEYDDQIAKHGRITNMKNGISIINVVIIKSE